VVVALFNVLFKGLKQHLHRRTEENQEKPQTMQTGSAPRIEPETHQIRRRNDNRFITMFDGFTNKSRNLGKALSEHRAWRGVWKINVCLLNYNPPENRSMR
jgi:hypothetical protein